MLSWKTAMSSDVRRTYETDGALILTDVIAPAVVASLKRATERLLARATEPDLAEYAEFESARPGNLAGLKRIYLPDVLDEEFARFIHHPPLVQLLGELLGPDVEFRSCKLVVKPSGSKATAYWHQDLPYIPHSNPELLTVSLHLDDFSDGEGVLRLIPGSHRAGLVPHREGRWIADRPDWLATQIRAPVPLGGLVLHHSLTIHSADVNRSPEARVRLNLLFRASHSAELRSEPHGPNYGRLVRGERRPARDDSLPYQADIFASTI
jgi:ectoine hydroxylase-related dioxygenase (phytanoyl-CoA dioxygenase family)